MRFFAPETGSKILCYLLLLRRYKPVDEIYHLLAARRGGDTSVSYVLGNKEQTAVPFRIAGHIGVRS